MRNGMAVKFSDWKGWPSCYLMEGGVALFDSGGVRNEPKRDPWKPLSCFSSRDDDSSAVDATVCSCLPSGHFIWLRVWV